MTDFGKRDGYLVTYDDGDDERLDRAALEAAAALYRRDGGPACYAYRAERLVARVRARVVAAAARAECAPALAVGAALWARGLTWQAEQADGEGELACVCEIADALCYTGSGALDRLCPMAR